MFQIFKKPVLAYSLLKVYFKCVLGSSHILGIVLDSVLFPGAFYILEYVCSNYVF